MHIKIEPNNGTPIYEQLVRQIKFAVAEGVVLSGQVIPSVREMAKRLALNPNTVQRAYLQLQEEQVLETLRGRGMAVAAEAKGRCVSDRHQLLRDRFEALVQEALHSGLNPDDLRGLFELAIQKAAASETTSVASQTTASQPNSSPSNPQPEASS